MHKEIENLISVAQKQSARDNKLDRAYIFEQISQPENFSVVYFQPFYEAGLFEFKKYPPVEECADEDRNSHPWPQARYIKELVKNLTKDTASVHNVGSKKHDTDRHNIDPKTVLEIVRTMSKSNNSFLQREAFFEMLLHFSHDLLTLEDVDNFFDFCSDCDLFYIISQHYVPLILESMVKNLNSTQNSFNISLEFFKRLFSLYKRKERGIRFKFLPAEADRYAVHFLGKDKVIEAIYNKNSRLAVEIIQTVSSSLEQCLQRDKSLDSQSYIWRPSIQESSQQHMLNRHDVPYICVEILYQMSSQLLSLELDGTNKAADEKLKTPTPPPAQTQSPIISSEVELEKEAVKLANKIAPTVHAVVSQWANSQFYVFKRLYLSLATRRPEAIQPEHSTELFISEFSKIVNLPYSYEIYKYLENRFFDLSKGQQDRALDKIENLQLQIERDASDSIKHQYNAEEKLRWLSAILKCSKKTKKQNSRAQKLYTQYKKTAQEPEHPEYDFYISPPRMSTHLPTPMGVDDMTKRSPQDVHQFLKNFEPKNTFEEGTKETASRAFKQYIYEESRRLKTDDIDMFFKLDDVYVSALLDGWNAAWRDGKLVSYTNIFQACSKKLNDADFCKRLKDPQSKSRWVISSYCQFIKAGTSGRAKNFDVSVYPLAFEGLKHSFNAIDLDTPKDIWGPKDNFSDPFTYAINNSRGKIIESIICLCSFKKENEIKNKEEPTAWRDMKQLLGPCVGQKNEVALHAMLGHYCRQFLYIGDDWFYNNLGTILPSKDMGLRHAFMNGFSYLSAYDTRFYKELKKRDMLKQCLEPSSKYKYGRFDEFTEALIGLFLQAYIYDDDKDLILHIVKGSKDKTQWNKMFFCMQKALESAKNKPVDDKAKKRYQQWRKKIRTLLLEIFDTYDKNNNHADKKCKYRLFERAMWLAIFFEIDDKIVTKIADHSVSKGGEGRAYGDFLFWSQYCHKYKDFKHIKKAGQLLLYVLERVQKNDLDASSNYVVELCEALYREREHDPSCRTVLENICKVYSQLPSSGPIKSICARLNDKGEA